MNPKDIMTDAIHNFHPQYQQYTQYSSGKRLAYLLALFISFKCFCYAGWTNLHAIHPNLAAPERDNYTEIMRSPPLMKLIFFFAFFVSPKKTFL